MGVIFHDGNRCRYPYIVLKGYVFFLQQGARLTPPPRTLSYHWLRSGLHTGQLCAAWLFPWTPKAVELLGGPWVALQLIWALPCMNVGAVHPRSMPQHWRLQHIWNRGISGVLPWRAVPTAPSAIVALNRDFCHRLFQLTCFPLLYTGILARCRPSLQVSHDQ